jgi:hypothetical protein
MGEAPLVFGFEREVERTCRKGTRSAGDARLDAAGDDGGDVDAMSGGKESVAGVLVSVAITLPFALHIFLFGTSKRQFSDRGIRCIFAHPNGASSALIVSLNECNAAFEAL